MAAAATLPAGLPSEMKAIMQPDKNSADLVLKTIPLPTPTQPDDVLVRVKATAPCAGELWWARDFPDVVPAGRTPIPCPDLAGVVVAAPPQSTFKPGDEVYARLADVRAGAGAQYAIAKEGELAIRPRTLDWVQTAATPLSALTAYQALFVHGTLDAAALGVGGDGSEESAKAAAAAREKNGKLRVLVTGASGGVGSWVVQLAALAGAGAVVAIAGKGKGKLLSGLGATEVVDYNQESVAEWAAAGGAAREVDLVVDCIGGASLTGSWAAVKEGGVIVGIVVPPETAKPEGSSTKSASSDFFIVQALGSQLVEIGRIVDAGLARPMVDSVWDFGEFDGAFARLDEGHAKGKIVIKVDASAS